MIDEPKARRTAHPESVKDCLSYFQSGQLSNSLVQNATTTNRQRPLYSNLKSKDLTFGMSTDTLNRKGGNLFADNSRVGELMAPRTNELFGLGFRELQAPRSKHEARELLENVGVRYRPGKFEGLWMRALSHEFNIRGTNPVQGTASVESLLKAIKELHYED